jgi:hypothetical protein
MTENERLRLPIHQYIQAATPFLVAHTVCSIHQPDRPLPPPAPNIQHQAQFEPGANTSAMDDINVLRNAVALKNMFPISSAD